MAIHVWRELGGSGLNMVETLCKDIIFILEYAE